MRVHVELGARTAIILGREKEYDLDLDLAAYTKEQRERLAKAVDYNGRLNDTDLLDERGDITPASVQAAMEREAAKKAARRAEEIAYAEKAIAEANADGDDYWAIEIKHIDWAIVADDDLKKQYEAAIAAWKERQDERKRLEKAAREEQERQERERERAEEAAAEQIRREAYCRAISRLGNDLQKRKWAAGLMAAEEVEKLVGNEYFRHAREAGFNVLPHTCHFGIDGEYEENVKGLPDKQFERLERLQALYPAAKFRLIRETGWRNGERIEMFCAVVTAQVDGIPVRADVVL